MKPKHPWMARFVVAIFMLILAFIGIIVTDLMPTGGWVYWKWIVPINAVIAIWLSWYERRRKQTLSPITIWHEILHWFALFVMVVYLQVYVHMGLLSRFLASLIALTFLSLTVFTIGIYVEWSFILIGAILAIFAIIVAIAIKYLYAFTIPALLIGIALIAFLLWRSPTNAKSNKDSSSDH